MQKPLKNKKSKVPKISEEEYAAYVAQIKEESIPLEKGERKNGEKLALK